jgi:hypothetical protein
MNNITHHERQEIASALSRWFQTQRVLPRDAVTTMTMLVGIITGDMATGEEDLAVALGALNRIIGKAARDEMLRSRLPR